MPPITRSLKEQNSENSSPFPFCSPVPCFPRMSYLSRLLDPTLAFRSPMKILLSLLGVESITACSCTVQVFSDCTCASLG